MQATTLEDLERDLRAGSTLHPHNPGLAQGLAERQAALARQRAAKTELARQRAANLNQQLLPTAKALQEKQNAYRRERVKLYKQRRRDRALEVVQSEDRQAFLAACPLATEYKYRYSYGVRTCPKLAKLPCVEVPNEK